MIQPVKLTLQGFRSFRQEQTLSFPIGPGFYFLSGKNQVDTQQGGSATGKSSLWAGLCWVLYGKTERELRASAVANWSEGELTQGSFTFLRGEHRYTVKRTWSPNSLTVIKDKSEPEIVEQPRIDRLMGYNYEAFLSVCLMGQFNAFFFDLDPTTKLDTFSNALGLDFWVDRADKARKHARDAASSILQGEKDEAVSRERISALNQQRAEWANLSETFESDKKHRLRTLNTESVALEQQLPELERQYKKAKKARQQLDSEREQLQRKCINADDKLREAQQVLRDFMKDVQNFEDEIEQLKKSPKTCAMCGQDITPEHFISEMARLIRLRGKARGKWELEDASTQALNSKSKELNGQLIKLEAQLREAKQQENKHGDRLDAVDRSYQQAVKDLGYAAATVNPYPDKLRDTEHRRRQARGQLLELQEQLSKDRVRQASMEEWAKLFKELRLWLIEDAIAQLQVEVNNSLSQLGLDGWEIRCVVEQETKTGTVKRGFDVLVTSPHSGNKKVPWKAWCGGETQRLRIAGAIGLQLLIQSRQGNRINLEVWDEPTAHLPEEGITDLLSFFESRAREERKQLWLVDHRSLKAGNFDGEVRIVKTEQGSEIREMIE